MTDDTENNRSDLKRFEIATRLDLNGLIKNRHRRVLREACCPSRVLRDRPNVRLDRGLLDTVRTAVQSTPDLKLQDAFEEALMLWLTIQEHNAAGISLLTTTMRPGGLAI